MAGESKQDNESVKTSNTGRTWPDLIHAAPKWLLGVALLLFAFVLTYSIFWARHRYSLGFLGNFGPENSVALTGGPLPNGTVLAWDPVIRDAKGGDSGRRPLPQGWILCGDQPSTPNLDGRFLMGASSIRTAGEMGGLKDISAGGQHKHTANVEPRRAFDTVCNGKCAIPAVQGAVTIDAAGEHTHGENRPPFYSVVLLCMAPDAANGASPPP